MHDPFKYRNGPGPFMDGAKSATRTSPAEAKVCSSSRKERVGMRRKVGYEDMSFIAD